MIGISCRDFLDIGLLLIRKLLNQEFQMVKLKVSLRKFYGHHHELVDLDGISVSQMITNMFIRWYLRYRTFFTNVTYQIRIITGFVLTCATRRVPHLEQDLLTLPEHLSSPQCFLWGSYCSMLCFVYYCLSIGFFLFFFCHGVVCLFSTFECKCPSASFVPLLSML